MIGVEEFIKFWVTIENGKLTYNETLEMRTKRELFESALHKFLECFDYKGTE